MRKNAPLKKINFMSYKVRFFDPGMWYRAHKEEIDLEISRVLSAGDLILRDDVERFEENLAKFVGTKYAVALNSGTDALVLAAKALNWRDRIVVVPSHTFKATAGAMLTAGAKVVIADLDGTIPGVFMDVVVSVHIAGELSQKSPYPYIEDAAQALGAVKNPTSLAQTWSFYPAKILGAYGDAGALTTNDERVYEYVKEARNHFKSDNRDFGINSRMDNLQAAILNVKFKYLPGFLARREEIAMMYKDLRGVELPNYQPGRVWQDYIVRTPRRDTLHEALKAQGVETLKNEYPWSPEYPKPPLAAKYEAETLRLPCNPDLTDGEVEYVIEKINEFFA